MALDLYPVTIVPGLQDRLRRQNPGRVTISPYGIRTGVAGSNEELLFRILEARNPLPGTPYRILALRYDPAQPLLPQPIGHFDYRIISGPSRSAISGMNHDASGSGDKLALRVSPDARDRIRGIGRALAAIALNHAALEGSGNFLFHNVMALDFFTGLSKKAMVVGVFDEDQGPVPFSEADPAAENVQMDVRVPVDREEDLPRILLTLRSEPIPRSLMQPPNF
jgi:hypothetical protein